MKYTREFENIVSNQTNGSRPITLHISDILSVENVSGYDEDYGTCIIECSSGRLCVVGNYSEVKNWYEDTREAWDNRCGDATGKDW